VTTTYQMKAVDIWVLPREVDDVSVLRPWGHHAELIGHVSSIERKKVLVTQLFPEYYLFTKPLTEAQHASAATGCKQIS
jgi:hypothetical protein